MKCGIDKNREYGLDILRVVCILMTITAHFLKAGGVLKYIPYGSVGYYISWIAVYLFYTSINSFAMISGYLYAQREPSRFRTVNILRILLTAAFWCILITIIVRFIRPDLFISKRAYLSALLPPSIGAHWYITGYTLLFFLMPHLNRYMNMIDKQKAKRLLLLLFVFFSLITTIAGRDFFGIKTGFSPFWLIYCYLIGVYFRLHGISLPKKRGWSIAIFISCLLLPVAIMQFFYTYYKDIFLYRDTPLTFITPFALGDSILMFYAFKRITIRNKVLQRIILSLSGGSLSVYIIHTHPLIYDNWIYGSFVEAAKMPVLIWIGEILAATLAVYLVCWLADIGRKYLFRWTHLNQLTDKFGAWLDKRVW